MEIIGMTTTQAMLVGIWYYVSSCFLWTGLGMAWAISKPLVGGTVVGIILGMPTQGMMMGAQINLLYIGFISAGGAQAADPAMAGILGTALALTSGLDYSAAIALAVPLGLAGNLRSIFHMVINAPITHISERHALSESYKKLLLTNVIIPQIMYFTTAFTIVFSACVFGPTVVGTAVENLPTWAMNGLNTLGGLLPCIGICLNLKNIGNKQTMPYFFLGFLMVKYLGFSNVVIAVIGCIIAYIAVSMPKSKTEGVN